MSLAVIIQTKSRLFIGSDSAIGRYSKDKYIRVHNDYKKTREYKDILYFIAGKLEYSNMVNKNIKVLYSTDPNVFSENILKYFSKYEFDKFDFEMVFSYSRNSTFYKISSYDKFILKEYISDKHNTQVYCVGFDNQEANDFVVANYNKFDLIDLYKHTFKHVCSNMVGGTLSVFETTNKNKKILDYKIDEYTCIEEIDNSYLLVVGDVIVGNILAGNNLRIANTNNNFLLDEDGAVLTDASFTMTMDNNKGKIILDPSVGIKIQNNSTGTFTDGIYLGSDGRIKGKYLDISGDSTFGGTLSGANGTFSGSLSAATGTFKGSVTGGSIISNSTIDITTSATIGSTLIMESDALDGIYFKDNSGGSVFDEFSITRGVGDRMDITNSSNPIYIKSLDSINISGGSTSIDFDSSCSMKYINSERLSFASYGGTLSGTWYYDSYEIANTSYVDSGFLKKYSGRTYGISQESGSAYSDLSIAATSTGITIRSGSTVLGSIAFI